MAKAITFRWFVIYVRVLLRFFFNKLDDDHNSNDIRVSRPRSEASSQLQRGMSAEQ